MRLLVIILVSDAFLIWLSYGIGREVGRSESYMCRRGPRDDDAPQR